jgi:hypothetical protein
VISRILHGWFCLFILNELPKPVAHRRDPKLAALALEFTSDACREQYSYLDSLANVDSEPSSPASVSPPNGEVKDLDKAGIVSMLMKSQTDVSFGLLPLYRIAPSNKQPLVHRLIVGLVMMIS